MSAIGLVFAGYVAFVAGILWWLIRRMPVLPERLEHTVEGCRGCWDATRVGRHPVISCTVCTAIYPNTPELADLAVRENLAGTRLQQLAQDGTLLLMEERERKERQG